MIFALSHSKQNNEIKANIFCLCGQSTALLLAWTPGVPDRTCGESRKERGGATELGKKGEKKEWAESDEQL